MTENYLIPEEGCNTIEIQKDEIKCRKGGLQPVRRGSRTGHSLYEKVNE
jgi:hypothetical protein